jgi:cysteine synthase A
MYGYFTLEENIMIYTNITQLIGNTPLFCPEHLLCEKKLYANILCKLEAFNPAGSAKDRIAKLMIEDAENQGLLKEGTVIIEPTSGNTGIGLAAIAASKGYRVILTMPNTMSLERRKLLAAYGAEIVLTDGSLGMKGAIAKAEELASSLPSAWIPAQFENPANPQAHQLTTGPEIWNDTNGEVDIFVAGVGTGGTLTGTGRFLKSKNPNVKLVAVEPFSSPLISKGVSGAHGLQGIGANFIPENLDLNIIDEVMAIKEEEAYSACRELAKYEGLLCGITSGAALFAALTLASKEENKGKTIVALLPDTGERYLSTPLFE